MKIESLIEISIMHASGEDEMADNAGDVYVLINPAMHGIVKIGRSRDTDSRVKQLNSATGVPEEFVVFGRVHSWDCKFVEAEVHRRLHEARVNPKKEFFRIDADKAMVCIRSVVEAQPKQRDEAIFLPHASCKAGSTMKCQIGSETLGVWSAERLSGAINRHPAQTRDYIFTYQAPHSAKNDISLTMPGSLDGYVFENELHPVFQMNLPEGRLRESITLAFRKRMPRFDDLMLLELVGRSQIGHLRFANDLSVVDEVPLQSVKEIVTYSGNEDLLSDLMDRFCGVSGVSGVQPKVLIRDSDSVRSSNGEQSVTVRGSTHIVKGWDANEYPHLAANEFFCMKVAERAGLEVPRVTLSENNRFLVIERFDLTDDGRYLGFEDFCSLNGLGTHEKYDGSYERIAKRIREFVSPEYRSAALETFFRSLAVSCALRNGDAHLKNFGVLYEAADKPVSFAPAYDIVTTTPYIRGDSLALTLGGSKRFPDQKKLLDFAKLQCNLQPARVRAILAEVAEAALKTQADVAQHAVEYPDFKTVAEAMVRDWSAGVDATCHTQSKQSVSLPPTL